MFPQKFHPSRTFKHFPPKLTKTKDPLTQSFNTYLTKLSRTLYLQHTNISFYQQKHVRLGEKKKKWAAKNQS